MTGLQGVIQHTLSSITLATDTIFLLLETFSIEFNQRLASTLWSIWKHRNLRVWDDFTEVSTTVVERAKHLAVDWQLRPHYLLLPLFILTYPIILNLVLLMKCYKHICLKKYQRLTFVNINTR
jgi:hypothetical protein